MSAKEPRKGRRWLTTLATPTAVAAAIAAGFPDLPNVSQAICLALAVVLSVVAGKTEPVPAIASKKIL
jgi:hypothetical protein